MLGWRHYNTTGVGYSEQVHVALLEFLAKEADCTDSPGPNLGALIVGIQFWGIL